ncbi:type II toxin-antitoxin system HigB family toxin [Leptospira bouyouniensis]|uniref:Type II toxin-antitoxin system HigB family toxin n=1 Tax=Leptospira bouyouniensis TaxID=2484911 RepID=A0ABY2L316_9LEPT|nr:type II toxin-antitoxin system HigB family toxin [Leptospira bouyouniensis]TGK45535.1 type II toxin-antitoxin system HigB family toxin [Leptospira bouyouniensis]
MPSKKNRIFNRSTLESFWTKHPSSESALRAWFDEAKTSSWHTTMDIKRFYPSASFIKGNKVIFNIGGNDFRLIVKIEYKLCMVFILFVGTHAEYDKIDANTL